MRVKKQIAETKGGGSSRDGRDGVSWACEREKKRPMEKSILDMCGPNESYKS